MGSSSTQFRLLALTCRLHDINLKAQNIMNQKISLATQKDKAYEDYCDALDATKIQVAFRNAETGNLNYVNANFSTLCEYSETRTHDYLFKDNVNGGVYVNKEVAETYEKYKNDKYSFALVMAGIDPDNVTIIETEHELEGDDILDSDTPPDLDELLTGGEEYVPNSHKEVSEKSSAMSEETFYNHYETLETPDKNKVDYYLNLWNAIDSSGGCTEMNPEYTTGEKGEQWFQNMVNAGLITLQVYGGNYGEDDGWKDTSVATSVNESYLQEVEKNDKELKAAETKYEYELGIIKDKDSKFDRTLKDLETEKSAIEQQMQGYRTIINENIERFSQNS